MLIQKAVGRTPEEVIDARLALLHLIPAELVQLILDDAEYWPTVSSTFAPTQEVCLASDIPPFDAGRLCLLTPKIPHATAEGATVKVREVRFEISSHDQGWGGENLTGPYEGSYTWFEAIMVHRWHDENGNDGDDNDLHDMMQYPTYYPASTSPSSELIPTLVRTKVIPPTAYFFGLFPRAPARTLTLETVEHPPAADVNGKETDVWLVQRNRRAWAETQAHCVVWRADHDTGVDVASHFAHTGAYLGDGAEFVNLLRPGDRIAVVARAQFPMWANWVRHARITVVLSV